MVCFLNKEIFLEQGDILIIGDVWDSSYKQQIPSINSFQVRCIKAGLWSQPMGDSDDEEEGAEKKEESPVDEEAD